MMIWAIYRKELKDALRDRKTLLLSVLLPMVLIVGMIFFFEQLASDSREGNTYAVGVESGAEQEALEWLNGIEFLDIQVSDDPVQAAENGEVRAAVIFQSGYAEQLRLGQPIQLEIYADQSSSKSSEAASILMEEIERVQAEIVGQRLMEIGVSLEQMIPFQTTLHSLHTGDEMSLMMVSMLLSLVIMMSVMLGGFPISTDLFAGEKERKTMEALLITPVSRSKLITAKWLAISTFGTVGGVFAIIAFLMTTFLLTEKVAEAFDFGAESIVLAVAAIAGVLFFALLFAAIQTMISIYAKSFKEAQNYLTPVMFLGMVPYFLLIGVSPNELAVVHFIIPFMNIFALLKELIYGIFNAQSLLLVSVSSIFFIAICFAAANWMFKKDKWVLGK